MKNILSSAKTAIILLAVTVLTIVFYTYMLVRPVSYGMGYLTETVYEGETFKSAMKFKANGTVLIRNTNLPEELENRYYYKKGYVFMLMAKTDEEYDEEVSYINDNFDEAVNSPFYADKIGAFKMVTEGPDGYSVKYVCKGAVAFAIIFGIVELMLVSLTVFSYVLYKKTETEEIIEF